MTTRTTIAQIKNEISPELEALIDLIDPSGERRKAIGHQIMLEQVAGFASVLTLKVANEAAKETVLQTVSEVFQAINGSKK